MEEESRDLESEGQNNKREPPAIAGTELEGDHESRNVGSLESGKKPKKKKKKFSPREPPGGNAVVVTQLSETHFRFPTSETVRQ